MGIGGYRGYGDLRMSVGSGDVKSVGVGERVGVGK